MSPLLFLTLCCLLFFLLSRSSVKWHKNHLSDKASTGITVADPGFLKLGGGGLADLTERYRSKPKQNRLSDSFVPFFSFQA